MRQIKVFVASSTSFIFGENDKDDSCREQANKLRLFFKQVQERLSEEHLVDNVKISYWWKEIEFKKAGEVLDTVQRLALEFDMGLFVFGEDVVTEKSNNDKLVYHPNSNVLIEFGMFKVLGKRIFIVTQGKTENPTDISNSQSNPLERMDDCVEGFIATIKEINQERTHVDNSIGEYKKARVYYDTDLSNNIVLYHGEKKSLFVNNYETKALFIGSKSAYCWEKIEEANNYIGNYFDEFVNSGNIDTDNTGRGRKSLKSFFKSIDIDNMISFGPGIGKIDAKIMGFLPDKCFYIPVDLNVALAIKSRERIMANHHRVPFVVIDDFEEVDSFYERFRNLINSCSTEIGHKNLFSMLGVTFSNLGINCSRFLGQMHSLMDADDYLLLDVIIADKIAHKNNARVTYKSNDTIRDILERQVKSDVYWGLIRNTIEKKGIKRGLIKNNIRVNCIEKKDDEEYYCNRTSVPGTKLFRISYSSKKNDKTLLIAKYYKYEKFKNYLKSQGFSIVASEKFPNHLRGIFVLKKSNNEKNQ